MDFNPGTSLVSIWLYFFIPLSILLAYIEGRKRTIGFIGALVFFVILTPLFGFLAVSMFPAKNRKGCTWCGNKYNEAEYCGLCGKNEAGEISPWFKKKA